MSPIIERLNKLFAEYQVTVRGNYPDHWEVCEFLEVQGLSDGKDRLIQTRDWYEVPYRHAGITITVRGTTENRRKHRVYVRCDCGKDVPIGRLHQHKCKGE